MDTNELIDIIPTPLNYFLEEGIMRDEKDRPIYIAAICSRCDIILSGDKALLEIDFSNIVVLSPKEFLNL